MPRLKVEFPGSQGGYLAGSLEYPEHKAQAYALFAHCFSCGKDSAAASRISRALVARGIAVLRFDFTGLGSSDGDFSNTNFSSNVADLVSAAEFLRTEYRAPGLLIGHSLGGTAVLAAADQIPESTAIVTIGAPGAPEHVIKNFAEQRDVISRTGQAQVDLGGRAFTIRQQFIEDACSTQIEQQLAHLRRALLIMHAPLDATVPISEAEQIYLTARHPKSFVSLDSADHLLSKRGDAEYAAAVISAWSTRYLSPGPQIRNTPASVAAGEVVVGEHNHQFARNVTADEQTWLADEPVTAGGQELGPDPYEHLLAALGTCTSMTIRMYASHKQLKLDDVRVRLRHDRESHATDCKDCEQKSSQLAVLSREITLIGDLTEAERQRLLQIADRCPVHRTLTGDLDIKTRLA